jgi:uncharacterized protein
MTKKSGDSGVRMHWGVKIPLRDGTRLAATVYLPEKQQDAAPTIFILTPYVAQSFHDRGTYFAAHGLPFVSVDARGRGNSEGEFSCFGDAAEDGFDVVEWLARQPYCNGKVAMWGGSYQGFAQWAVCKSLPPHLATIVPVASAWVGLDTPMRNNVFSSYMLQWLYMVAGRTLQDKLFMDQSFWSGQFRRWFQSGRPFDELDTLVGQPFATWQQWLDHPQLDEFWDRFNPGAEHYAAVRIPVLTITGIHDGDQPGALMHYREHLRNNPQACHYLVIGPWDHAGTRTPQLEFCGLKVGEASLVDLPALHAEWYAWTMQDGPRPEFLRNKVAYYVMGAERWRYAETLDAVTARVETLHLHSADNPGDVFSSGALLAAPPVAGEPDRYVHDPRDVSLAELESAIGPENLTDQRLHHAAAGRHLVYHSAPFERDIEISGFFRLSLWLSLDQPDTDIRATVHEVGLDGSAVQLTEDFMRARYREGLRRATLVRTNEPLEYVFERFTFVSRLLRAGSRLRLIVGPLSSIFWQKNYNSGGDVARESVQDARIVTVRLFHDPSRPSALYVPTAAPE